MKIIWCSDIHLNFLQDEGVKAFLDQMADENPDCILIGGDVGEAHNIAGYLQLIAQQLNVPVYFVLGNHDFYRSGISKVRKEVEALCEKTENLTYLSSKNAVALFDNIGLVGHDGWGDARYGSWETTSVRLNDFVFIEELQLLRRQERIEVLRALGDEAAEHIRNVLPQALENFQHVIILTHVPPWPEACWHGGAVTSDKYLPFFACKAVGEAIFQIAGAYPHRNIICLCGHTHFPAEAQILPNLRVIAASSDYHNPQIELLPEFESV